MMNWFFTQAKCAEAAPGAPPDGGAPYQPPPGAAVSGLPKKTDFLDLPLPVKYEELQREIMSEFRTKPQPSRAFLARCFATDARHRRRSRRRVLDDGAGDASAAFRCLTLIIIEQKSCCNKIARGRTRRSEL